MIKQADPGADRCAIELGIGHGIEEFRRIAKVDAQLVQGAVGAGEAVVNEVGRADLGGAGAAFPIRKHVIRGMPQLELIRCARPAEPPFDHAGLAARHPGQG